MIHGDWDFTLSAVLLAVSVVVVTATGEGRSRNDRVEVCFRSSGAMDFNLSKLPHQSPIIRILYILATVHEMQQ